jgi:signal transduction histidine kinase
VSLTISIMRFRLWNIDVVINRTLVYGALTAMVAILYGLVVGGLGLLFRPSEGVLLPLLATVIAAVAFQPLRERVQGAVNRMMYGERDDPVALLSKLGAQLEDTGTPEAALAGIVETVALALKLPFVAIEWGEGRGIAASFGLPSPSSERLPLMYQGEVVGHLLVADRRREEPLSAKDLALLENIAQQAGAIVYNARLKRDLLRAREHLVTSREEERRRIRRDLHDGLGPELAGLTLKLDAARNMLSADPASTERLLVELKGQAQTAVANIRRLAYNLRPPALDDLGLLAALRERAAMVSSEGGPRIYLQGPQHLPSLPAAVEVASYRIAQEAINNAVLHSGAKHCWVRLSVKDELRLEITDDGHGIPPDQQAGVGITSMRERANELGGFFQIERRNAGGTRVLVQLPLRISGP